MERQEQNPLGEKSINKLIQTFAIPSIISMLVGSLYNIVDQFFIGQRVGELGNAATNIAFPLSISCIAIALLFGIGGAAAFNLAMGAGDKEKAKQYMANALSVSFLCGLILCVISQFYLEPMLKFFGSPSDVLGYAKEYTRITALGFPMLILSTSGAHMIRADGRPNVSMICNLSGAIVNTVLDALFVFQFDWGMSGAAYATVIGQCVSGILVIWYLAHAKTVTLERKDFRLRAFDVARIASLGMAPFSNQLAMMVIQIVMNNTLKYYGARSVYGESIPIACVGIISKVNMVFMAFIIGLSQALQPIASFNYGARKYKRVKEAYKKTAFVCACISVIAFVMFQVFPRQIIIAFGKGTEEYYQFAIAYFRIFLFCTFVNFIQPITSNFFTSIGKPKIGGFLALTRQILFLLPLLLIFPLFMGIDGVMYAGPVADGLAALVSFWMVRKELRRDVYR